MKKKKVNRTDRIGIAALAVAMILLSCAVVVGYSCDEGDADVAVGSTYVEYARGIQGVGYENINTETSTGGGVFSGIQTVTTARGTGESWSQEVFNVDTSGASSLYQDYQRYYYPVVTAGGVVYDRTLSGATGATSYSTGAVVSDKYSQTYSRTGTAVFTGDSTQTEYSSVASTYGQTNFGARVVGVENHHHTLTRVNEQHIGNFATDRNIRVEVIPSAPVSGDSTDKSVCRGRSP